MTQHIDIDYLIVGAGATAMAFVDTMLDESDATFAIVDRYDHPGGHWRKAYEHVRLHHPANYYGVNSRPLGSGRIETHGLNKGLVELSSRDEIRAYYQSVMQERFIPSGRVHYLPMTDYDWDAGVSRHLLSGEITQFTVHERVVDSTFMNVTVPSARPPKYDVAPGVRVIPPNGLSQLTSIEDRYVIVGAGKTGVDAVLWLLEQGVDPDRITWVRPRDPWLANRDAVQSGPDFAAVADGYTQAFIGAFVTAESLDDLLDRMTECKWLLRLSDEVRPKQWRCATVSEAEVEQLRRVTDFTSREDLGRITAIRPGLIEFQRGERRIDGDPLYVDCSADGLKGSHEPVPVFSADRITLQPVSMCQVAFSAAFIAHVEARFDDDQTKNTLTRPVPNPSADPDFVRAWLQTFGNEQAWNQDEELVEWLQSARLSGLRTRVGTPLPPAGPARTEALAQFSGLVDLLCDRYREYIPDQQGDVAAVGEPA